MQALTGARHRSYRKAHKMQLPTHIRDRQTQKASATAAADLAEREPDVKRVESRPCSLVDARELESNEPQKKPLRRVEGKALTLPTMLLEGDLAA